VNVHEYIDELGGEGQLDSSARFTMDPVAALRKYRSVLQASPALHVLKLIQAMVGLGATSIEVTNPASYVRLLCHLPGHSPEIAGLEHPEAALPEALRIGLQLALATEPAALQLFYCSPLGGWMRVVQGTPHPLPGQEPTLFAVTMHREGQQLWRRLFPDATLQKELSTRCAFATIPITLDGRRLNRPAFAKLPGLPYEEMPRGSLLQRSAASCYPVLAARFRLVTKQRPGLAVAPPLYACARVVRTEGTPAAFLTERPAAQLGAAHYEIADCAPVQSVTERAVDQLTPTNGRLYHLLDGTPPRDGALWLHTRATSMQTIYESKYVPGTNVFWLPQLHYQEKPPVLPELLRYWTWCGEKRLFDAPMLNASQVLLMRSVPAHDTFGYFVDRGVLLNPVRLPSARTGPVFLQRLDNVAVDASFLTPVHSLEMLGRCEVAQLDYEQLCRDMHRLVTTVSELNLPQPTIELWREALRQTS
jgi:hypothetical protein